MIRAAGPSSLRRPVEVVGREQPQRDHLDADLLAPAEQRRDVGGTGPVAVRGVGAGRLRPAPVAVEHDADVLGQPVGGELPHEPRLVGRVRRRVRRFQSATSTTYSARPRTPRTRPPDSATRPGWYVLLPCVRAPDYRCGTDRAASRPRGSTRPPACRQAVDDARRARPRGLAEVKPQLRGWLHAAHRSRSPSRPASCWSCCPRPPSTRVGSAVFAASALCCCSRVSAIYHRGTLVPADDAVAAPARPRQHLPADRRHLHAVHAAAARRHTSANTC